MPAPGGQVTLQFGGEQGLVGRLRVSVRGAEVHARIVTSDPAAAQRMSRGLSELRHTLAQRGFTEARVTVQQSAPAESGAESARREDARNPDERRREPPAHDSDPRHAERDRSRRRGARDREER